VINDFDGEKASGPVNSTHADVELEVNKTQNGGSDDYYAKHGTPSNTNCRFWILVAMVVGLVCLVIGLAVGYTWSNDNNQLPFNAWKATVSTSSGKVPMVKLCSRADCPTVSRFGMGTLHLGQNPSGGGYGTSDVTAINTWIQAAVDIGINLFDCSDVYPPTGGSVGNANKVFGQALALTPGLREQIIIVAKMDIAKAWIDSSSTHLTTVLETNYLGYLSTDYVDIVMLHMPDSYTDAAALAATFVQMYRQGKARHFGLSDHKTHRWDLVDKMVKAEGLPGLVTHEIEFSVWNPSPAAYNNDLTDHAQSVGYRPLAWGPLGGGPLGGLNRLFDTSLTRGVALVAQLNAVGAELGITNQPDVVAIAWLLNHPVGAIPLLGTTNVARMKRQALDALNVKMTHQQWYSIAEAGNAEAGNAGSADNFCYLGDLLCDYSLYMPLR